MKPVQKVFIILVIIAVSIPVVPLQSAISAPDPVVSPGVDPGAILVGAVKYRAFTEGTATTTTGVYLGLPKLNNKHYRSELDLQWTNQNAITFTYDVASDWLTAEVTNANGSWATTYNNFSANVTDRVFGGDTTVANNVLSGLNYLEIIIQLKKDQPTLLSLHDVHLIDEHLDDYPLGNFIGDKNKDSSEWMVTGHDVSGGFVLTADLHTTYVIGPDDLNNIIINFGYQDQTGPVTSNVLSSQNPAVVDTSMTVTATVDDSLTGGLSILSSEYSIDAGVTWGAMNAVDGAFDEVSEDVTVTRLAPSNTGTYDLCVRGTDSANNIGEMTCISLYVLPVSDDQGPEAEITEIDSNPVVLSNAITITATIDDSTTGGSPIGSAEFSLDGGTTWSPMDADDGSYGDVTQGISASTTAPDLNGNYMLCVRGTDMSGNLGDSTCTTLFVLPAGDAQGPIASSVAAVPNPVVQGSSLSISASVDDSTTGGSQLESTEFSLDNGATWTAMQVVDGTFDEVTEAVIADSNAPSINGNYNLCVRGTDMSGNTGSESCVTLFVLPTDDTFGPLASDVMGDPNPAIESGALAVTATVDDTTTGGSQIASAEFSLDNGTSWAPMQAVDGTFNEVAEDVTVSTTAPDTNNNYQLCVRGTDMSGNTGSESCITLFITPADDVEGPLTDQVGASPNPVIESGALTLSATVDDTTTGGSQIASAEFSLDGGSTWALMHAVDGTFDEINEDVAVTTTAPDANGNYQLCVRGTDMSGNTGSESCITLFVTPSGDVEGPLTDQVSAIPNTVLESGDLAVTATVDDSTTGGSQIASAEFSLDNGTSWAPMQAVDGTFDEVTEDVTVSTTAPDTNGNYQLCVRGTDMSGNLGDMACTTLEVEAEDNIGPLVSDLSSQPNPVIIRHSFVVGATIDDSTTGGATIAGAEYSFNSGPWTDMDALDGDFDEVSEVATASLNAPNIPDEYTICVRGSDTLGNTGGEECITVTAYIPKIYLPIVVVATSVGE